MYTLLWVVMALLVGNATLAAETRVQLNGTTAHIAGKGAVVSNGQLLITAPGTYRLAGSWQGQVLVNVPTAEPVRMVLDTVRITSSKGAAVEVRSTTAVVLELAARSSNELQDSALETERTSAVVHAKGDLTITGTGKLSVRGRYKDGIESKRTLNVQSGQLSVTALRDGLRAKQQLIITAGEISVQASGDGLQASGDQEDASVGDVQIKGGSLTIVAAQDGVQAAHALLISNGVLQITSGGGAAARNEKAPRDMGRFASTATTKAASAKALKAEAQLTIQGGTITIDAADDGLHASQNIAIAGGKLQIATADDGVHADKQIQISGGTVEILRSYEGIESEAIVISGGTVRLVADDDGVNLTSGTAQQGGFGPMRGQRAFGGGQNSATAPSLTIKGGYLSVDALGDGIDANGRIQMSGGMVVVYGPTASMNGALDYDMGFPITGGILVAVGSAGMAQAPDSSSTQNSALITLNSRQPANTPVYVTTDAGDWVVGLVPARTYQSVVMSSPALLQGKTYVVYTGGKLVKTDGQDLARGVTEPGVEASRFTVNGVVTGQGGGGFSGFGGMGGRGMMR